MRAGLKKNHDDSRQRLGDRFMLLLSVCLLGYALLGRGFAYAGVPPLYIGEVCLLTGVLALLVTRDWTPAMRMGTTLAVLPLVIVGAVRLFPSLHGYWIEAARDAVVWGYAAFAIIVATLIISRPERLPVLIERYRLFTRIFLIGIPIVFVIYRFGREALPGWPGSGTKIIQIKEGDALVHLSGILAFWMADPKRTVRWLWAILLTMNMALLGVIDRAGVVTFFAVMMICLLAKPFHGAAWRTIAMLLLAVVLLWASAIRIEVPGGKGRDISWQQFKINALSVFGHTHSALDDNKEWRINWWKDIIDYTVNGKYFWTGKGFGINLADDDGYQVTADHSLRSPHNVHMTVLARMGVPGAAAWLAMHATWLCCVGSAYLRARRRKNENWAGIFLFLFAYYAAFMINGSFDVFIEGPMGGVWFWSIYGVGVGALWTYRYRPYIFADEVVDEGARRAQLLPAAGWGGPSLPLGAGVARVPRA